MSTKRIIDLNAGWSFSIEGQHPEAVCVPHTPKACDLNGSDMWTGVCEYSRELLVEETDGLGAVLLRFEGLMQKAEIRIDGKLVAIHSGGYLPLCVDVLKEIVAGRRHQLTVTLDNRHDAEIPPGKALDKIDFCWHGGIYRTVSLELKPRLHITDEAEANKVAGGGIFVRYPMVTADTASISVAVDVRNRGDASQAGRVRVTLLDDTDSRVADNEASFDFAPDEDHQLTTEMTLLKPKLWFPDAPNLYRLRVEVIAAHGDVDSREIQIGIRRFVASRSRGLEINGKPYRLLGTNRHQEYPYLGYALSDAAQWRDAMKIKNSGFDYVRCSHYPQSPAFLDACDALGIVVMSCIPGWQYFGSEVFQDACEVAARELVRRDRNHPSAFFWELSLNEAEMPDEFMARMHHAGHEEYPGDQFYTCGWIDAFDLYIRSRQHDGLHTYRNGERALIVAEYGDWEFYASNGGFNQDAHEGVMDSRFSSRQQRGDGELAQIQQARNFIEAVNENLSTKAIACGQWAFCDYTRGYHSMRATMGVRDIFRLPKYAHYFYRSQRPIGTADTAWDSGAMVFIASNWEASSSRRILVFSNAEQVELLLNGERIGVQSPSISIHTQYLRHPPFVFDLDAVVPGILEARALVDGTVVACDQRRTTCVWTQLRIVVDSEQVPVVVGCIDTLIVHVECLDESGVLVTDAEGAINITVRGPAELIGPLGGTAHLEAGIASCVLRTLPEDGEIILSACATGGLSTEMRLKRSPVIGTAL
ncbi:glycoside hydrolase family 2 TIM barrel-domain containing protein [Coraliomargarita sp. SDUM461004]|uniref:Glycoside hydrolase family 2 TIM barrel-domain containing protein n=1 Tax=Thalassobacterium sedimentorum TaxID=3041258 RepID=A0ABU1AGX3_9BACT|nr:glycoside hydrolase family 2 TIM barrel-domain containing protein [Coraliomargarita sp. SDUM461004]MDQ8193026.1 glycoside hydrolase family 2 TIM barrel-domain containing protein [Coraliomargarita sp. SDUM461004]